MSEAGSPALNEPVRSREAAALDLAILALRAIAGNAESPRDFFADRARHALRAIDALLERAP